MLESPDTISHSDRTNIGLFLKADDDNLIQIVKVVII